MAPEDKQDPPLRIPRRLVDEETPLRIRPDERTPPEGHDPVPVHVPDKEWVEHGRRKDTAQGLATEEEPVEQAGGCHEEEMPSHAKEEQERVIADREQMSGAGNGQTPREAENRRRRK